MCTIFLMLFFCIFGNTILASFSDEVAAAELGARARRGAVAEELARESVKDSVAARVAAANEVKKIARESALEAELAKPY